MSLPLSIQDALNIAGEKLALCSEDTSVEASLLLAHVLGVSRTHLHTRPEQKLQESQCHEFFKMISRRLAGEPIAYLIGCREFWSLELLVNKYTLIPRPETELLVELALQHIPPDGEYHILDLGTGSGAIALAIASERPQCHITATDISPPALDVASANAQRLNIRNVTFHQGSWFAPFYTEKFDVIVSNPPYVAQNDPHLLQGDLPAEPSLALVAGPSGMEMITTIAQHAPNYLQSGGWLLLEHGYNQGTCVANLLNDAEYFRVQTWRDLAGIERITIGQH
jgi:release factor glutamine methyltransferase